MSNDKNSCQENCKAVPGSGDQSLEISWTSDEPQMNNDEQWWTMMTTIIDHVMLGPSQPQLGLGSVFCLDWVEPQQ